MKVKNIRHFGIIVSNIENSLKFYVNMLGLKEVSRGFLDSKEIERLFNLSEKLNLKLDWVKLETESKQLIELWQPNWEIDVYDEASHIAFTIDNADELFDMFINNHEDTMTEEMFIDKKKKHKLFFACDPDGNSLEFVEEL